MEQQTSAAPAQFSRNFLLLLLITAGIAFLLVIRDFILMLVLGAVFATLFRPVYRRLLMVTRGKQGLSAFLSCTAFFLAFILIVFIISQLIVEQAADLYQMFVPTLAEGTDNLFKKLQKLPLLSWAHLERFDWQTILQESARTFGAYAGKIINTTSRTTVVFVIDLFVLLYSMYYFLKDCEGIIRRIRYFLPMSEEYKDALIEKFLSISRATVRGTLLVGLIQGGASALALLFVGVKTWLLWGVIIAILSVVPVLGSWTVLIPIGIGMIVQGRIWQGFVLIVFCLIVISIIDDILRPILVGRDAQMPNLIILVSTLGGLVVFGFTGFIIGPLIAAFFFTILDIYGIEFRGQLNGASAPKKSPPQHVD